MMCKQEFKYEGSTLFERFFPSLCLFWLFCSVLPRWVAVDEPNFLYPGLFTKKETDCKFNPSSCTIFLYNFYPQMRPNNTFNLTRALETTTMWNKTHDHFNRTMPPPSGRPPMNPQDRRGPVPFPPNHMHSNMTHEEFMNKTRIMFTNCIKGNEVATSDSCGAAMKMASCFHDQKIKVCWKIGQ